MTCFLGCSCGEFIQGLQCPWAQFNEDGKLIYEGELYTLRELYKEGYDVQSTYPPIPVLRHSWMYGYTTLTVNESDTEKNFLFLHGGAYYVKDRFNLPQQAFESEISNIVLETRGRENNIQVNLDALEYPVSHIAESEKLELNYDTSLTITCYLQFVQYDLLIGWYSVEEYDEELYLVAFFKWYKIKDEYQEIFRNAIEELNA